MTQILEGKLFTDVCMEKGRILVLNENGVGWFQINISTDHRGRPTESSTSKFYPFRNVDHIEWKIFIGGNKKGLIQLELFKDEKKAITIEFNERSEKALKELFNNYSNYENR